MFCEKCGTKSDGSSKFCEKCGAKLEGETRDQKKKINTSEKTKEVKEKLNSLSKKQKIIGAAVIVLVLAIGGLYYYGNKVTNIEYIATKAFEELSKDNEISDKYMSVSLDSDEYVVSLKDNMKKIIEEKEIDFDYDDYSVKSKGSKVVFKYKDESDDKKYSVTFRLKANGKTYLFFDKYEITNIKIARNKYSEVTLYDPEDTKEIKIEAPKNSIVTIEGKDLAKSSIDKKASDDLKDVYKVKGIINNAEYEIRYTVGKIPFKKSFKVNVRKKDKDYTIKLTSYISTTYLESEKALENIADDFEKYITTYYEYVNDGKSIKDFKKKYDVSDEIKDIYEESVEESERFSEFDITNVTYRSMNVYKDQIVMTFKVDYSYTLADSENERDSWSSVNVTYNLKDTKTPVDLKYLPY